MNKIMLNKYKPYWRKLNGQWYQCWCGAWLERFLVHLPGCPSKRKVRLP